MNATAAVKHSTAGLSLLNRIVFAEKAGRLVKLVNNIDGSDAGLGWAIPSGDGGSLAAALRLEREGAIKLVGMRHRRYAVITELGRASIAKASA